MARFDNNLGELEKIFNKIFEQFNCPICLNELNDTFISIKCAHRFCENCIKTSVDQYHKCPLCNHPLDYTDIIRDNHFDSLKDDLRLLKEKKIEAAFDNITNGLLDSRPNQLSPIENVLKNHLMKTLMVHQNYSYKLKENYEKEVIRIDEKKKRELEDVRKKLTDKKEIESEMKRIELETLRKIENLKNDFDRQIESIANRFKKYLEKSELSPLGLPAKIKIRLVNKNVILDGFEFKINDEISEMYGYIKNEFIKKLNDPIVEFPENLIIFNIGPFSKYSNEEAIKLFDIYEKDGFLPDSVELINAKNCFPIMQYFIKPESEFLIFGDIKFESDLPKRCFKYTFDKNKPKPINYYNCIDCELKWICKFCMEQCHKDHNIRQFSMNHNSNWACCFCDRKNCSLKEH